MRAKPVNSGNVIDRMPHDITFASLLEAAPDAIVVATSEGRIVVVNLQAEKIFGYSRDELLGQDVELLVPDRFRGRHPEHRRSFASEGRVRPMGIGLNLYGQRKDGSEFPVEISLSPLRTDQGALICSVIRDITSRRELEAQLEASRAQIVSSARLSALGMMAGGVAHEINNPLGIIHAYASNLLEMAREGEPTAPAVEAASARIIETAERIASIVKSLRHISRQGDEDPVQPASLQALIEQVLELSRERFRLHTIRLTCPAIDPHLKVPCREVQIAQVLLNLLQNAFDAVAETSGERWVEVKVGQGKDSVVVAVSDSGPGIPVAIRSRIMEPFFTTKPVGKGTGLGLSLSRSIARGHGGDLTFSEQDGHTCFSLILPLAKEADACN
jgi:PAS domain S-box-containing protein